MPFQLSPASLVDQRASEYPILLLSNSTLPSITLPWGNSSTQDPLNFTLPQIFVVNPSSDNIFRHVDPQSAHAAIIGLIYFSMWMGALGWDIVSTIPFDVRVIRETTWSSSFSCIYSIAYLLSRYVSLSWLITAVTNSVIMTDHCDAWMKGSTALFSIAISATMLVFCLRACSIWHMHQKVVSLVVSAWFMVVAFAVLLPVMSGGTQIPTSNFCAWHFNGLYVVGVFGALLVFDLICLIVTVCKLNKAGWRGLLHGLFPSSRHNLDAEDVKTMLVQKTTAFFAIQFLFLISALLVYVLTDTYAYRMMNIVASVAVASSMAGRIFRRAWRQTRELAPHNMNRPPSYFPAWAEEHRDAAFSRTDLHSVYASSNGHPDGGGRAESAAAKLARAHRNKDKHDSLAFYVEGEFRPQLKARSPSNQSLRSIPRTPNSVSTAQQMREMEAGHAGMHSPTDTVSITPSTIVIARGDNLTVPGRRGSGAPRRDSRASQSAPAPAYSRRLGSSASSRPRTGEQETSAASTTIRPKSAGQISLPTPASLPLSTSERATGDSLQEEHLESDDPRSFVMEEKRRTFIASPPLSAAGLKLNRKEVYDFDSVRAAAKLGAAPAHLRKPFPRPATASSVPPASSFDLAAHASPGRVQFASAAEGNADPRCASGGSAGSSDGNSFAFLKEDPLAQDHQRTPRPRTAPNWPSPSSSASDSGASHMTLRPRGFAPEAERTDDGLATSAPRAPAAAPAAADEDALLAFLNTVEQDSRDRAASHTHDLQAPLASASADRDLAAEEGRPRTSRGNTACSNHSCDTDEDQGGDVKACFGQALDVRGRRASSPARPRSGVSGRETKSGQRRGSSSAGVRSRAGTSDGINSGNRPSTAVGGEAVKPFGFGVLAPSSRRGSRAHASRDAAVSWISDDDEGEAEAELGSVIEKEYAKLAAHAQMSLD
ncbi:uncharacterized protein SRS1_11256 [Sporisorium reilianum f. sp. reilianum]|uniref:Uncharacterized protein n=1 Tax=Sporisorium reilianum f. sp. reilianum TaxID=72559 RepID=A0A2N8UNH8_9BASI|nr:uncharacterized protein SRS1_11256 [Sporisorium reilianum f. sp. reilianum]